MIGTRTTAKKPDTGSGDARNAANARFKRKPIETYGEGRRCPCGALLSVYNPGTVCAPCREAVGG